MGGEMAQDQLLNRPCGGRFGNVVESIGNTPLVELPRFSPKPDVRIYAKLEGHNPTGSVKDRVAKSMIEAAEAEGAIEPGQTILEPTSGNTGIALAMICRRKGYPLKVVMPDNVTEERTQLLQMYGAEIVYSEGAKGSNGAVELALEMAKDPSYYMPYQYGNEANPRAHYEGTAPEILEEPYNVLDVFFATPTARGASTMVRTRLKNLLNGAVLEKSFKTSEKFPEPDVQLASVSFLYNDSDGFHFMDQSTYEQFTMSEESIGDDRWYLKEGTMLDIFICNGNAVSLQLPQYVELTITSTEPGVRGDTALHEDRAARWIDAQCQVLRSGHEGATAQLLGILRERDRVQVDDAEIGVVLVLQTHPLLDRTQRVAEMQGIRRGLDTGEDDGTRSAHGESILARLIQWIFGRSAPWTAPAPCARTPSVR